MPLSLSCIETRGSYSCGRRSCTCGLSCARAAAASPNHRKLRSVTIGGTTASSSREGAPHAICRRCGRGRRQTHPRACPQRPDCPRLGCVVGLDWPAGLLASMQGQECFRKERPHIRGVTRAGPGTPRRLISFIVGRRTSSSSPSPPPPPAAAEPRCCCSGGSTDGPTFWS